MSQTVGPLEVGEIKAIKFDFDTEMDAAASLSASPSAPEVSVVVLEGTDATPNLIKVGSPSIVGRTVVQKVQPGVVGVRYKLRCLAYDDTGLRHGIPCELKVVPA